MAVLINEHTKVICQGFTGSQGTFHSEQAIAYGTRMVGGVTPGKGEQTHLDLPAFNLHEAKRNSANDRDIRPTVYGRRHSRSHDAEMELIVAITEGIPVLDMMKVKRALMDSNSVLIGPNCPGVITPDACKLASCPVIFTNAAQWVLCPARTLTYGASPPWFTINRWHRGRPD